MGGDRVNKLSFALRVRSSPSERLKVEFGVILFPVSRDLRLVVVWKMGSQGLDLRDAI